VTRTLFISDLHLSAERPATNQKFFEFLETQAARAQALTILGDLFEYWLGDDELQAGGDPLARNVAAALRKVSDQGTRVSLMHGNRDFLLAAEFCRATGATLLQDPTVVQGTLLMHGDTLCTDDHDYQSWRRTARSPQWQRDFLAKSVVSRRAEIEGLRKKSKEVVTAKPAEIMDVNADAVKEAFRRHKVRRLIHGHTHRPARHEVEVDGHSCVRWVLPDWYGPGGYLVLDDAGARLISF
jgi:UDP-2,3-diacylglucosamine hydrolase